MADSNSRRRKAKRIAEKIVVARSILAEFDIGTIEEILRRGEFVAGADGMRGEADGTGGPDKTTSVESAALYGLPGDREEDVDNPDNWNDHIPYDRMGDTIVETVARLDEVVSLAKILDKNRQVIIHAADGRRARPQKVGHCQACGRLVIGEGNERLRSGYCDYTSDPEVLWSGCYRRYVDQKRPDRLGFERWVASQMALQAEQRARDDAERRHTARIPASQPGPIALPNSTIEPPELSPIYSNPVNW